MSKLSYEIPTSLDASFLDVEVPIKTKEGVGFQAVPLRVILFVLASSFLLFFILFKTFVGRSDLRLAFVFTCLWITMTALLVKYDKSRRMGVQLIMPLLSYTKANRRVPTRRTDDASGFYSVLGINSIQDDGLITFSDGGLGYCYRVVGTASILLFDEDKAAILNRVDSYYRKVDTQVEHIYLTNKEPQLIHNQLVALNKRYQKMERKDPDLVSLVGEQEEVLTKYVGGQFKTIHQYLILKAKTKDALRVGVAALTAEIENSSMMFRQCTALYKDETMELLTTIFG